MKKVYSLENITCSHCATMTESRVNAISGVNTAMASFRSKKLTVNLDDDKESEIDKEIQEILANPTYCKTCPNR